MGLALGQGAAGLAYRVLGDGVDLLGEGFDLHGAGDDLVFPHHENERVQAEGAGHPSARHWIHAGMVTAGGEKMAKSVGNFTTISDALDRHGSNAFRVAALNAHYHKPTELGENELEAAATGVGRLDALRKVRAAMFLLGSVVLLCKQAGPAGSGGKGRWPRLRRFAVLRRARSQTC